MNEDFETEILIEDGCTPGEARRLLFYGTQVYANPQEWIENLKESGCFHGETIDGVRKGKYTDVSIVTYKNHEYLIEYCA